LHPSVDKKIINSWKIIFFLYCDLIQLSMLAQGKTLGSMLQQSTNKTLTTIPFGNTCEADEASPEVEARGLHDVGVYNQVGTQICDYNT
jgi:hypothetical protein